MKSRPEAPAVSAATKAPGMMLVPGWVSMRKVSHLPPAIAISALAKAAPPFVTRVPSTMMVAPAVHTRFFLGDELHGLRRRPVTASRGARTRGRGASRPWRDRSPRAGRSS